MNAAVELESEQFKAKCLDHHPSRRVLDHRSGRSSPQGLIFCVSICESSPHFSRWTLHSLSSALRLFCKKEWANRPPLTRPRTPTMFRFSNLRASSKLFHTQDATALSSLSTIPTPPQCITNTCTLKLFWPKNQIKWLLIYFSSIPIYFSSISNLLLFYCGWWSIAIFLPFQM